MALKLGFFWKYLQAFFGIFYPLTQDFRQHSVRNEFVTLLKQSLRLAAAFLLMRDIENNRKFEFNQEGMWI